MLELKLGKGTSDFRQRPVTLVIKSRNFYPAELGTNGYSIWKLREDNYTIML